MTRQLTVDASPLPEDYMLGLRERAAKLDFPEGSAELDHSFGYGSLTLSLTVTMADGTQYTETAKLTDLVKSWVTELVNEHKARR